MRLSRCRPLRERHRAGGMPDGPSTTFASSRLRPNNTPPVFRIFLLSTLRASGSFRRPFSLCFEPSGVSRITCPDVEQVSEAACVLSGLKAHIFFACILAHIFRGIPVAFLTRLSL